MPYSFSTKKQMLVFGVLFLQPADKFGFVCFGIFLFCFCLVQGEKVPDAQDFGWQSKGEDHFKSWFPFFSCLLVTILYCSDIVWSKDLYVYFFRFLSIFDWELFFFFCFLPIFDREFLFFFCFLPIFDRELSLFWKRVSSSIVNDFFSWETPLFLLPRTGMEILILGQGLWWFEVLGQKACKTAGHDVC